MAQEVERFVEEVGLTPDGTVLDIGCGPIRPYSEFLVGYFRHYFGADLDPEAVTIVGRKTADRASAGIARTNVETLSFKDNAFDVVVCNDMLTYTDKRRALQEIIRVLKDDGRCFSISNNMVDYSLWKIAHPTKFPPVELAHSLVVLINTLCYRLLRLRFFRTTFSTAREIASLVDGLSVKEVRIWTDRETRAYRTIGLVFKR